MKLNRISIIFCLLGLAMPSFGSNITGNTEFLKRNYEGAIEKYKETLTADSTKSNSETFALFRIGECYSNLKNPGEAVNYLNDAIISGYHSLIPKSKRSAYQACESNDLLLLLKQLSNSQIKIN